jgi:putative restriction endonuclease
VSPRLRSDYGNGDEFYSRSGTVIELPDRLVDRPSRESVEWHMDERFLA